MKTNPHFQGLRTAIFRVTDMEKAKAWYSEVLGIAPYFDEPFYIGFEVAGYELGLQPDKVTGKKADNILVYWGVEDIQTSYDRLISLGAKTHEKPTNVGGEIWVATVKDPWGNVFGIIQNPHFKL
jgi:predicted enzyme related to lactoylglutathione lyase